VPLSDLLRTTLYGVAAINLVVGGLFLFGPELDVNPWPTDISPPLMRFIGAIVAANGVGSLVAARQGTWEGTRALFAVALVYGLIVLVALPAQLLWGEGDDDLWGYVAVDGAFIGLIAYTFAKYERGTRRAP
jgi:hypothetical protein